MAWADHWTTESAHFDESRVGPSSVRLGYVSSSPKRGPAQGLSLRPAKIDPLKVRLLDIFDNPEDLSIIHS